MQTVTKNQLIQVLNELGLEPGDRLLVHSAIQFLGKPAAGVGQYLDVLQALLGPQGCLAVPTFNFAFARGEAFHPQATPSQGMGVFSEFVRLQPGARRTLHPLQSLALLGACADGLAGRDTPGAFDSGSAFDGLLELDFKLLLLGASIQAVSMIHYSEQRAGVPYRYWKEFHGPVWNGRDWQMCIYRMYARDLEVDAQLDLSPLQARLEGRGQWRQHRLNYGQLAVCRLADFTQAADEILAQDPWALVGNREAALATYRQKYPAT